jgi:endonuclease/exonuclease/phosphatase family metal-dependent hydrolase
MKVGEGCVGLVLGIVVAGCSEPSPGTSSDTGAGTSGSSTSGSSTSGSSTSDATEGGGIVSSGRFSVLTYNVAGLPQGISSSDPERSIPQISPLLNAFDLVVVQEDFFYHAELIADVEHPHVSVPFPEDPVEEGLGDGLNRFSTFAFGTLERTRWPACNGQLDCSSDCLARKGWSYARMQIDDGVEIDVYNLHMEAGGCPEDIVIRQESAEVLVDAVATRSAGRAVVMAGDFNLRRTDPEDVTPFQTILDGASLLDACDATDCGDERIDHILFRSGDDVLIEVERWWIPPEFVDAEDGTPLSDHLPVAAEISYGPR